MVSDARRHVCGKAARCLSWRCPCSAAQDNAHSKIADLTAKLKDLSSKFGNLTSDVGKLQEDRAYLSMPRAEGRRLHIFHGHSLFLGRSPCARPSCPSCPSLMPSGAVCGCA